MDSMKEPNAFTWGTCDKFGQEFGVPRSRSEKLTARRFGAFMKSPEGRFRASLRSAKQHANKKPVTKIKLKFLGDD